VGAGAEGAGQGAGAAGADLPAAPVMELVAHEAADSTLRYQYTPTFAGTIQIAVTVLGWHVLHSPFPVQVRLG
jgi:hypothetical protein